MSFTVTVDLQACQGYACCLMSAPAVFDLDDAAGKAVVLQAEQEESARAGLEQAVRGCPARAILIEG